MTRPNTQDDTRSTRRLSGALAVLFWVVIWQVASMVVDSEFILAGPLDALGALIDLLPTADFWHEVLFSAVRIIGGTAAGYLVAIALAALSWRSRLARTLAAPALSAIKSTPVACVVVVLLIWFGSRNVSAIAVFLMALPGIYFPVLKGLETLDAKQGELFRLYRTGTRRTLLAHIVPGVLPYLVSASATVLSMSWKAGVAAELIGVPDGSIGERIYQAKLLLETADLFAWTIVVVIIAWAFEHAALAGLRALWPACGRTAANMPPAPSEPAANTCTLEARELVVGHDGRAACAPIDCRLQAGDALCLLGPSGAGKTTVLYSIAGFIPPVAGSLEVVPSPRFSAVFQESRLIEDLTAIENIMLFARAGVDARALAEEVLPPSALDVPVRSLSGGQRRRAELVRAFAAPADITLLDEPFSGLDAEAHRRALAFIERHRERRLLIVSTHDEHDPQTLGAQTLRIHS